MVTPIAPPRASPCAQIEEGQLRKVVRLVTADSDYDEDMSRAEVHRAAGQLLATPGNLVRFHKSLAQLDAKRRWSALSEQDRQPWEERAAAETSRWNEWKAAEASTASASAPQAAGKKKDKDSADAKGDTGAAAKKKDKEKDKEGGGGKGGGGRAARAAAAAPAAAGSRRRSGQRRSPTAAPTRRRPRRMPRAAQPPRPPRGRRQEAAARQRRRRRGRRRRDGAHRVPRARVWVGVRGEAARERDGREGVGQGYISPEGERFTSRVSVHLGLEVDPLDGEAKPQGAALMTKRERAKARVAEARARLPRRSRARRRRTRSASPPRPSRTREGSSRCGARTGGCRSRPRARRRGDGPVVVREP